MNSSNSFLLNRIFTRNTIRNIINDDSFDIYTSALKKFNFYSDPNTNKENIQKLYQILKKSYQNEYYYKNTLLNKLLLGIYSVNTTTALTEVPIANSKADFLLINGKAVVYEIKTDLDNFERLDSQINDYYKAFSRVVVVISENNYEAVAKRLHDTPVGIYILTARDTISIRKEPIEYMNKLSKTIMFKILRKPEYEEIIIKKYGKLPAVSQFLYYKECCKLFESLDVLDAYEMFLKTLKMRYKINVAEYEKIPYELKFVTYFSELKKNEYKKLNDFLER